MLRHTVSIRHMRISHDGMISADINIKDVVNKFGGLKSIIKLSSNNLMHNYMFSVIYKLGKMTSFAIFLFQL